MSISIQCPDGTMHLAERTIRIPRHISQEAQRALAQPMLCMPQTFPPLSDKESWNRLIAEFDGQLARLFAFMPPFQGRVESCKVGQATLYEVIPDNISPANEGRAILYIHGGGFVYGGGELAAQAAQPMASFFRCRVYSIDYRMPPDHPFPAALDDSVAAYRHILERHAASKLAVMGISAGGNLTATCILKARDLGLPLPGAAIMNTPSTDATQSGDTWDTHQDIDVVLKKRTPYFDLYTNGHDPRDPYVSPVFAKFGDGFPPTLLISGTRDALLSDTVMVHRALRREIGRAHV